MSGLPLSTINMKRKIEIHLSGLSLAKIEVKNRPVDNTVAQVPASAHEAPVNLSGSEKEKQRSSTSEESLVGQVMGPLPKPKTPPPPTEQPITEGVMVRNFSCL